MKAPDVEKIISMIRTRAQDVCITAVDGEEENNINFVELKELENIFEDVSKQFIKNRNESPLFPNKNVAIN